MTPNPELQRDWEAYLSQVEEFVERRSLLVFAASEVWAAFCNEVSAERAAALCADHGARCVRENA